MRIFQGLTRLELEELLFPVSAPEPKVALKLTPEMLLRRQRSRAHYRAKQIFHWVYQRKITQWEEMTDLSKPLRIWLAENFTFYQLGKKESHVSKDGTYKVLWELEDHKTIESVIIPASSKIHKSLDRELAGLETSRDVNDPIWTRLTACISSQVGCAMACGFCLTGIQGLDRHLQVHEIVAQVDELRKWVPLSNIVFMGMGEPLHNFENVVKACEILLDSEGHKFSRRRITISTSGLVPAIQQLAERLPVGLAVSLNATTDEQRTQIMPVNKKWNIQSLLEACKKYADHRDRRVTFEYVLIRDFNDTLEDAKRLVSLMKSIPCKINLIPFNEHPGAPFKRTPDAQVRLFQKYLLDRHLTATIRISRGRDILAACGQLRSLFGSARGTHKHRDYQAPSAMS